MIKQEILKLIINANFPSQKECAIHYGISQDALNKMVTGKRKLNPVLERALKDRIESINKTKGK